MPICDLRREQCVNTEGGYGCRPMLGPATHREQNRRIQNQNQNGQQKQNQNNKTRMAYQTVEVPRQRPIGDRRRKQRPNTGRGPLKTANLNFGIDAKVGFCQDFVCVALTHLTTHCCTAADCTAASQHNNKQSNNPLKCHKLRLLKCFCPRKTSTNVPATGTFCARSSTPNV